MPTAPFYPCSYEEHRDDTSHRASVAVVYRGETHMIGHYLCAAHALCTTSHDEPMTGVVLDNNGKALCAACVESITESGDKPNGPDLVPLHAQRYRELAYRPQPSELAHTEDILAELNKLNTLPGTCWYAIPEGLTETAKQSGRLAQIRLVLLTDHAASRAGLLD